MTHLFFKSLFFVFLFLFLFFLFFLFFLILFPILSTQNAGSLPNSTIRPIVYLFQVPVLCLQIILPHNNIILFYHRLACLSLGHSILYLLLFLFSVCLFCLFHRTGLFLDYNISIAVLGFSILLLFRSQLC